MNNELVNELKDEYENDTIVPIDRLLLPNKIKKILSNRYDSLDSLLNDIYHHFNNLMAIKDIGEKSVCRILLAVNIYYKVNNDTIFIKPEDLPYRFRKIYDKTVTPLFYADYLSKSFRDIPRNKYNTVLKHISDIIIYKGMTGLNSHTMSAAITYCFDIYDKMVTNYNSDNYEICNLLLTMQPNKIKYHTFTILVDKSEEEVKYHIINPYLHMSPMIVTITDPIINYPESSDGSKDTVSDILYSNIASKLVDMYLKENRMDIKHAVIYHVKQFPTGTILLSNYIDYNDLRTSRLIILSLENYPEYEEYEEK